MRHNMICHKILLQDRASVERLFASANANTMKPPCPKPLNPKP